MKMLIQVGWDKGKDPIQHTSYQIPDHLEQDLVNWLEWAEKVQQREDKLKEEPK